MLCKELINPRSIVVVGGSDDTTKPGGAVLRNILTGNFGGELYVINPKSSAAQGVVSYPSADALPAQVECAVLAIAAKYCADTVRTLTQKKGTKGFIILSAGFHEENAEGAELERQIVEAIDAVGGSLIGPNCVGMLNANYNGVFTLPIPALDPMGADLISGSGSTALFIIDSGMRKGLRFNSFYSVGNSAQVGIEEVLEHLDETFDPATSSRIKLLYIENLAKPDKLLKHAVSLIHKGCRIAAIKAGSSDAGSRAASSHTGALASSDVAVGALLRKAGIVRCYGREELTTVGCIFTYPQMKGNRMCIITHAGGPAVMLTDILSERGVEVPPLGNHPASKALLEKLYAGSSIANPIDFLSTGTAPQLDAILNTYENEFTNTDGAVVIFGNPGLFSNSDVNRVIADHVASGKKPIYPVFPSYVIAKQEIDEYTDRGYTYFPDEVIFGDALTKVMATPAPAETAGHTLNLDVTAIRDIVDNCPEGYISPEAIRGLLDAAGIPRPLSEVTYNETEAVEAAHRLGYPLVMRVVGPVHKSEVGGVKINLRSDEEIQKEFRRMIQIPETTAIMLSQQAEGMEIFIGAKREKKFGHTVLCGMGGIFIEVLKDVQAGLAPLSTEEAIAMIRRLKCYKMIQGVRKQKGIDENLFAEMVVRLSLLVRIAPEIAEMDINPMFAEEDRFSAVDVRIRIERE